MCTFQINGYITVFNPISSREFWRRVLLWGGDLCPPTMFLRKYATNHPEIWNDYSSDLWYNYWTSVSEAISFYLWFKMNWIRVILLLFCKCIKICGKFSKQKLEHISTPLPLLILPQFPTFGHMWILDATTVATSGGRIIYFRPHWP